MEPEPNARDGMSPPITIRIADPGSAQGWRIVPASGIGARGIADRAVGGGTRRARAASAAGWFGAAVVVAIGGLLIWHLLFGATVGGDVWLGHTSVGAALAGADARVASAWVA